MRGLGRQPIGRPGSDAARLPFNSFRALTLEVGVDLGGRVVVAAHADELAVLAEAPDLDRLEVEVLVADHALVAHHAGRLVAAVVGQARRDLPLLPRCEGRVPLPARRLEAALRRDADRVVEGDAGVEEPDPALAVAGVPALEVALEGAAQGFLGRRHGGSSSEWVGERRQSPRDFAMSLRTRSACSADARLAISAWIAISSGPDTAFSTWALSARFVSRSAFCGRRARRRARRSASGRSSAWGTTRFASPS